jgi:microcystin-dependent protein
MADPFVAEVRMFGFSFAPTGWAQCAGQILPISQNTALFSLLGTTYGGDGKSTFALPDMEGNVALSAGQSTTGTLYDLGQVSGSDTITLLQSEMPAHGHALQAVNVNASTADPSNASLARGRYSTGPQSGAVAFYQTLAPAIALSPLAAGPTGSSFPHNNLMPTLVVNFCIALQGVFPPRT